MGRNRSRWLLLAVLVAAFAALVGSIAWVGGRDGWRTTPGPMMGYTVGGGGPVRDLAAAEDSAQEFARRWGLDVGEVMQFDNGFYAELVDSDGNGATEVLIDPRTGATQLEWGPAMMWNTTYGMHHHGRSSSTCTVDADRARDIAGQWLRDNRSDETPAGPDAFPGYYTLHTLRGDTVTGMLSVHCYSGEVWYHDWHGQFVSMSEHQEPR
ncbi:hypothetical protein FOH10_19820 [Nocardia otitidiscaviarum]|uniref:PepSY domain-containing protein n=2 Tax=Nocardia otitidiscaviarum TaxID=1823 RepID=A0A516NXH9_9NOCA|nr:hypothetical protein FOH10_19820 [Nocardia otitidiscaviarum]